MAAYVQEYLNFPHRICAIVRKWKGPKIGEPDEIVRVCEWREADGSPITDAVRLAELEASTADRKDL